MPSRNDGNLCHPDSPGFLQVDRNPVVVSSASNSKTNRSNVSRPRTSRRTTRIPTSTVNEESHCKIQSNMPRLRRRSMPYTMDSARSQPTPSSPKSAFVFDKYVSSANSPMGPGVEPLEDENSFSSSVFSEHLGPSELPLVMRKVTDSDENRLKSHRISILSSAHDLTSDEEDADVEEEGASEATDQVSLVNEIKSGMTRMLIHTESGASMSALVSGDDVGSSDGEEEEEVEEVEEKEQDSPDRIEGHNSDDAIRSESEPILVSCSPTGDERLVTLSGHRYSVDVNMHSHQHEIIPPCDTGASQLTDCVTSVCTTHLEDVSVCSPRMMTRSQTVESKRKKSNSCSDSNVHSPVLSLQPRLSDVSTSPHKNCDQQHCDSPSSSVYSQRMTRRQAAVAAASVSFTSSPPPTAAAVVKVLSSPKPSDNIPAPNDSNLSSSPAIINLRSHNPSPLPVIPDLNVSSTSMITTSASSSHPYPLRSRLRRDSMRRHLQAAHLAPKSFSQFPSEVLIRIIHYLNIQDVFRLQLVSRRLKSIVEYYLLLVKRINFSNGLPFAFLPQSITDSVLKRILSRTPEVTHILGFYPKHIGGSNAPDCHSLGGAGVSRTMSNSNYDSLTYGGIITAFRHCTRLRSVELMDVELMSKLVHYLPRIKFHGMFRNRPDSWDSEFAISLPTNPVEEVTAPVPFSNVPATNSQITTTSTNDSHFVPKSQTNFIFVSTIAALAAVAPNASSRFGPDLGHHPALSPPLSRRRLLDSVCRRIARRVKSSPYASKIASTSHSWASRLSSAAATFDPLGEHPLGQGSHSAVPYFLPFQTLSYLGPLVPWDEQTASTSSFAQDATRAMSNAVPFLQPGIPPLEAELISAYSFIPGDASIPVGGAAAMNNNQNNNNRNQQSIVALAFNTVFVIPRLPTNAVIPHSILLTHAYTHDGWRVPLSILRRIIRQAATVDVPRAVGPAPPISNFHPIVLHGSGRNLFRNTSHHLGYGQRSNRSGLVSPLPTVSKWIGLPHAITNLTKLDLVSVAISSLPRLDNIKYLQLKWVLFTSSDPFFNFSASKLQSFVMNNCCGQPGVFRFVRMFSGLARAPQLARLELVGVHFVDGLLANIIDISLLPGRGFRNLQRLVLASNKDSTEFDVGLLMMAGQQSLNFIALQLSHTQNSLFESLLCSQTTFPRLEHLILGYQDPYQSRLTASELLYLGMGESSDNLTRVCNLTDWGVNLIIQHLCPRLGNLTIRHAPYLHSIVDWLQHSPSASERVAPNPTNADEEANVRRTCAHLNPIPLRSLTLENCPGISIQSLEEALMSGSPFPNLETLVLRDMFVHRLGTAGRFSEQLTWEERMLRRMNLSVNPSNQGASRSDALISIDWCRVGLLYLLGEFLSNRGLAYSSQSSDGIGMSQSVREVLLDDTTTNHRAQASVWPNSFDLFYSLRLHHYLNCLLELDGSCGPQSFRRRPIMDLLFMSPSHSSSSEDVEMGDASFSADFVSQSTQTCLCGQLEWHMLQSLLNPTESSENSANQTTSSNSDYLNSLLFAFHPHPPSVHQNDLLRLVSNSEWTEHCLNSSAFVANLVSSKSPFFTVSPSSNCPGCSSDRILPLSPPISSPCFETNRTHHLRKWIARDASIDTSELRYHTAATPPLPLTIYQPQACIHRCLTSLHFEKVGLSHLVICGAPQLKNITLENCPQLRAILFTPPPAAPSPTTTKAPTVDDAIKSVVDLVPCLRRIRIIRCPQFAIYHLLHAVASLYPSHEENISITYRPFGHYDGQVERALWSAAKFAHVLISHDYKQNESERQMEEFHSSFDQIFREVINFTDMLIRRELLNQHPRPNEPCSLTPGFRRSEHGFGWDLVTDIPWIHEICCSILRSSEAHRCEQADQFYEILSELQSFPDSLKLQHRGIHFHVQYRDVHLPAGPVTMSPEVSKPDQPRLTYHPFDYSESYLSSTHPSMDQNAFGDGCNEAFSSHLPPPSPTSSNWSFNPNLTTEQRLLLAQEEEQDLVSVVNIQTKDQPASTARNHRASEPSVDAMYLNKKPKLHDPRAFRSDYIRLRSSDLPVRSPTTVLSGGPSTGLRKRSSLAVMTTAALPGKLPRLDSQLGPPTPPPR